MRQVIRRVLREESNPVMRRIFRRVDSEKMDKIFGDGRELDDEYGGVWKEAFKSWFMESFGKPVARIKY